MIYQAIFIGIVATAVMDLIAVAQSRLFAIPSLDYAMVGRWIGHLPQGRLRHPSIKDSAAIEGEAVIGWAAHYLIGILFAAIYLELPEAKAQLAHGPLAPVLFGLATVAAPFLLLQPAMGAGIAARRLPFPWAARRRSLFAHGVFGVGLWIGYLLLTGMDLI